MKIKHSLKGRCLSILLLTLLLALTSANKRALISAGAAPNPPALALNGKIAFTSLRDGNAEIYVMNADGSNQTRLTNGSDWDQYPAWSPDGSRIAFQSTRDNISGIFVINADGSGLRRVTFTTGGTDYDPTWSPDGGRIAFIKLDLNTNPNPTDIYVVNADGNNLTRLTNAASDWAPVWSPDGTRLAFQCAGNSICAIDADGHNRVTLAQGSFEIGFSEPNWSPDGRKIACSSSIFREEEEAYQSEIFVMNADGSDQQNVTQSTMSEISPAWSPDGNKLVFSVWINGGAEIFTTNLDGSGRSQLTNSLGFANGHPSWQPVRLSCTNPIDCNQFFVNQNYFDFLNRDPDPAGLAAWQAVLNNCSAGDLSCDRIHVSSAFFRSPEFQGRGYFLYRFYPVAFGRKPDYVEFRADLTKISGFLSDAELESAKQEFIAAFMTRPAFATKFNGLDDTSYVDTLLNTAGITLQSRDYWIAALGNGSRTRAQVLREVAESTEVYLKYYNQAFVVMQYFGYLKRQPDALYLNWISYLDTTGDYRNMINGFMNSVEYRGRFGP
jgi:TolB protein